MRALTPALAACVLAALTGCASIGRSPAPRSVSGTAAHGDVVAVPSGTVNDWSLMVAAMRMGVEEPRSESDNRLLAIRVFATVANDTSWQVTAQYRFGYALDNASVFWVPGSANYLLVRR
jgi:hypothetical protein